MKLLAKSSILLILFLTACSGVQSEVKKNWQNDVSTLNIEDLTVKNYNLMDAGTRLHKTLEDSIGKTGFQLVGEEAKFHLKYKIVEYDSGSPLGRIATLGVSYSAQAKLRVKVALYNEDEMVGGWEVNSWLKGGLSDKKLFAKAAEEIAVHLKGDL
ncbi:MAG: hypothetical protein O3C58_03260 [Nitrospinae bacterium]|nr:hypothetical protein [Nitrospinota bacterium]